MPAKVSRYFVEKFSTGDIEGLNQSAFWRMTRLDACQSQVKIRQMRQVIEAGAEFLSVLGSCDGDGFLDAWTNEDAEDHIVLACLTACESIWCKPMVCKDTPKALEEEFQASEEAKKAAHDLYELVGKPYSEWPE